MSTSDTGSKEQENTKSFHLVDFIGWNNHDWEVMRHYHAADVVVRMYGQRTESVEPHLEALRKAVEMSPESRIIQHSPNVAQGEWTAVVGHAVLGGTRMATVARWRNGQIMEEYIFAKEIPGAEMRPTTASPMLTITTPKDADIEHIAGLDLGGVASSTGPGESCNRLISRNGSETKSSRRFASVSIRDTLASQGLMSR